MADSAGLLVGLLPLAGLLLLGDLLGLLTGLGLIRIGLLLLVGHAHFLIKRLKPYCFAFRLMGFR
ncbi:hypothetical protein SDC9_111444 [bioreactor metagenome]|uniref:Uncharacterized protein n=1 Tax=bioreactor metagenome TaxID=1076179 RepID=A0A645BGR7_9ZZZZ